MSYVKQDWTTGDVITAESLNHVEDGIGNVASDITTGSTYIAASDGVIDIDISGVTDAVINSATAEGVFNVRYAESNILEAYSENDGDWVAITEDLNKIAYYDHYDNTFITKDGVDPLTGDLATVMYYNEVANAPELIDGTVVGVWYDGSGDNTLCDGSTSITDDLSTLVYYDADNNIFHLKDDDTPIGPSGGGGNVYFDVPAIPDYQGSDPVLYYIWSNDGETYVLPGVVYHDSVGFYTVSPNGSRQDIT